MKFDEMIRQGFGEEDHIYMVERITLRPDYVKQVAMTLFIPLTNRLDGTLSEFKPVYAAYVYSADNSNGLTDEPVIGFQDRRMYKCNIGKENMQRLLQVTVNSEIQGVLSQIKNGEIRVEKLPE